jgi:aerobic carbon-monoxide dehydrogenase medium subunit
VSLISVEEYLTPDNESQVLDLLMKYGDGALIVAGGSFVHGLEARNLLTGIVALIDIRNLGLNRVRVDAAGLSVGAMVTFAELQQSSEVQKSAAFGAVLDALRYPPMQIRNVATVGGNVASACPYFDLPTAFMALGARVQAQGPESPREIGVQDFFAGLFENTLEKGEYVTGILLPTLPAQSASAFLKLETNANDLAIVNAAVRITVDASGTCKDACVAIGGGVAETPVRSAESENLLKGRELTDDLLQRAGKAVQSDLEPLSDHRASAGYRSAMARVLTERALRQAMARLE